MQELLDALSAEFDNAEVWLRLVDAEWSMDDLRLTLSIRFDDQRELQLWEIACSGVVEELLCSDGSSGLAVSTDSPLTKSFLEPMVAIMFSQNEMSPESLFGLVCSCCIEVTGTTESINSFLNGAPSAGGIASSSYGLLGQFPESLALKILDTLRGKPILCNALAGRLPTRWDGVQQSPYGELKTLQFGRSYVIAEAFSARRA